MGEWENERTREWGNGGMRELENGRMGEWGNGIACESDLYFSLFLHRFKSIS